MKIVKYILIGLLLLTWVSCSSEKPSDVIRTNYDCYNKGDVDCMLKLMTDAYIERAYKTPSFYKEAIKTRKSIEKNIDFSIDSEASTETTSEIKVTLTTYFNDSNREPLRGKLIWVLKKQNDGKWKIDNNKNAE